MTALKALVELKKFIELEVASGIKLQKEESNEFVNPVVELVYLPHKNFSPQNFQVPYIYISLDSGADDTEGNSVSVRLTCATYGGGFYEDTTIPDAKGYIDLINLIELCKNKLIENYVIGGKLTLDMPIKYGMYDTEITWPYWYGYLSFSIDIPSIEPIKNLEF